jgi:hypothetical protein
MTAFGGAACPEGLERTVPCNIHLCPTAPIGESGTATFVVSPVEGAKMAETGWQTYLMNTNLKNQSSCLVLQMPTLLSR